MPSPLPFFTPTNAVYATATSPSHPIFGFLYWNCLVEEADDLAGDVLATGLLVVHDTSRGGQDHVAELTRGQQADGPLLEVGQLDVVAGGDDTGLVEAAEKVLVVVQHKYK